MRPLALSLLFSAAIAFAQGPLSPAAPSTSAAQTAAGPLFTTPESELHHPITIVALGDTRFTNPGDTTDTNPTARRDLVARITQEHPDGIIFSGDLPFRGLPDDYAVFQTETEPWRTAGLRFYPTLGDHELSKCGSACLQNWWDALSFMPQLRGRRWYSAQLGSSVYILCLDAASSMLPGSEQRQWLEQQIAAMAASIRFVFLNLHHPPVADIQTRYYVDHNPRPNEISLADYLQRIAPSSRARFVVIAGHTHNYERFEQGGVTYFVSGGGGAKPYQVDRTPIDLYQDPSFPNYHYLRFTLQGKNLKGEMIRLQTPIGPTPVWQTKDTFTIKGK